VRSLALGVILVIAATELRAQDYDGYFSSLFLVMPDVADADGNEHVAELRTRLLAEGLYDLSERIHVRAGFFVETLAGHRGPLDSDPPALAAIVRPGDAYVEFRGERADLRAGMSRIVWGRLDEIQPTDVVNPIDLSRFLLEGRSEARLPVALVRGRAFLPHGSTLEGIVVPFFRSSRFDQLEEETSPFRLAPPGGLERRAPATEWGNVQGGARFTSTVGRFDWGVSAWRGFEGFPTYVPAPAPLDPLALFVPTFFEVFPRFTMVGADFETVRGPWGLRGEAAWFRGDSPRSFEGGIGADRRAGDYRIALNTIVSHADVFDVTFVGWAERNFARDTRRARLLAVYDPDDDTAFVRAIGALSLRENVWLELSGGWFTGNPQDVDLSGALGALGLLSRRDFIYTQVKIHF